MVVGHGLGEVVRGGDVVGGVFARSHGVEPVGAWWADFLRASRERERGEEVVGVEGMVVWFAVRGGCGVCAVGWRGGC